MLLLLLASLPAAALATDELFEALHRVRFFANGTVRSTDVFVDLPMNVSYNEPDNVTCSLCGWAVHSGWTYPWLSTPDNPSAPLAHPPLGVRSAPQLGGVSAGSLELRADGSFREWTILNQGPAGSGKFGLVDDVWAAVKVNGRSAQVLRTHPPRAYAKGRGVSELTFAGTHPVTRLGVAPDDGGGGGALALSLFAYSTLRPGDLNASAFPAVVLTLAVDNSAGAEAANVSLGFHLPFAAMTDCARHGDGKAGPASAAKSPAACLHACTSAPACKSWHFDLAAAECTLNADVPLTSHSSAQSYCGVRGRWTAAADGSELSWVQGAVGDSDPSTGSVTLRPVGDRVSLGVGDDFGALLDDFDREALVMAPSDAVAAAGMAAARISVPAGERRTASVVFAWHFPNRDFSGQVLGNAYAGLWNDSSAVALALADRKVLAAKVRDVNLLHGALAHEDNPAPLWLKDTLLQQLNHLHMLMHLADGRSREYEAFSCDDVNSVHNDYQRHLLYLWLYPETEKDTTRARGTWAQADDGHVLESLSGGPPAKMDVPRGRVMGDTTSLFVLEVYELWRNTGDEAYVRELWPGVKKAVGWMLSNAGDYGMPQYVTTTYDHFQWEKKRATVYSAHIFLTALEAYSRMAAELGADHSAADAAKAAGEASLTKQLWNDTEGFFHAHTDGPQVFTDSLYGQMLAHHNFGRYSFGDTAKLRAHLAVEWRENQDAYGMRVLSHPVTEDAIWMNGPPTWSYLALQLGELSMEDALEPLRRMSENFRTRLRDPWNLRALTYTETAESELERGAPREQGHYGFMMTDLYLHTLLSGVRVDLAHTSVADHSLTIDPLFTKPYTLPVLAAGCVATLTATEAGSYRLCVVFGATPALPKGGLVVEGVPYPGGALDSMQEGECVSW